MCDRLLKSVQPNGHGSSFGIEKKYFPYALLLLILVLLKVCNMCKKCKQIENDRIDSVMMQ